MWRKIDQLDSDREFPAWAKVIIRFEALKYRRNHARRRWVLDDQLVAQLADESVADQQIDPNGQKRAVRDCLATFDSQHRTLLLAPYCPQSSVQRLAEQSNLTPNALYKKLGRLREKLHACVSKKLDQLEAAQ